MADQMAAKATPAKSAGAVWTPTLQVAGFLIIMMKLGGTIFGGLWGMFSEPVVERILAALPAENAIPPFSLLTLSLLPLTLTLLTLLCPLAGWWIYSKVEPQNTSAVGWGAAIVYALADAAISFVFSGMASAGAQVTLFTLVIGVVIAVLYAMFFMGLGFNLAKLFKAKL